MSLLSKRTLLPLHAIAALVATLCLGAFVAQAASDSSSAQRTTWGRLKALYRPAAADNAGSTDSKAGIFKHQKVTALVNLSLSPNNVVGGGSSLGQVGLNAAAPAGGAVVTLSSSNPALASAPSSVLVPAGSRNATFTVTTTAPTANSSAVITGTYNGGVRTATLAVGVLGGPAPPPPPPAAALSGIGLVPASVIAGNGSQGAVTLTAAAPAGGALVALSSSDAALVGVPANVNVAGGATSATFAVTTTPSAAGGKITVTATYLSTSKSATLAVAASDPCASVTGLGGDALISSATVPQFRTGRLRIDLVGDVSGRWINAMGGCTASAAPAVSIVSGTGDVILGGASVTSASGPLTFGPLAVPPAEAGTVLATDAAGNVLQIIWPALAGLPAGPPVMRMNLASWSAAVQTGVSLDATMTFNVRSADGSTATFTAHGTGMIVPTFRP